MSNKDLKYFAEKPLVDLIPALEDKIEEFYKYLQTSGLKKKWEKNYQLYYGNHFQGSSIGGSHGLKSGGEEGELTMVTVNNFRNLLKHILIMTTSEKLSFDVRAINGEPESLNQARLGNPILDFYFQEKRLGRHMKSAVERSLVIAKGFVSVTWDKNIGRPYDVQEYEVDGKIRQKVVFDGDVAVRSMGGMDVIYNYKLKDWSKNQWVITREWKNKFDLIAQRPELRDAILNLSDESADRLGYELDDESDEDLVPVWSFYHKRTDAMPNGRMVEFCDLDSVIYDGPIPYDDLPVYRVVPGEIFDSPEGYTDAYDLVSIQELQNILVSTAASNNVAFGVQNVLVPEGSNLTAEQLTKNLRFLKYNPLKGKPEPLQLTASPAELYKLIELCGQFQENLSGVNSAARGNPEASLKSGVALSLVQSMAVQFASGLQQSYAELAEDVGTAILRLLQNFAKTERMISLGGESNRAAMASFTGDKIKKIDRAVVELGNPMAKTTAGRLNLADNLLEKGLVKTPQEYITVMETGQLDPAIRSTEAELQLVHAENSAMLKGEPVRAIIFDAHLLHLQEHKAILADPTIRQNEKALAQALQHIQEHVGMYKSQDPLFAMINGEAPAPQPPLAPMPPPPPGPAQGPGPNEQGPAQPQPQPQEMM